MIDKPSQPESPRRSGSSSGIWAGQMRFVPKHLPEGTPSPIAGSPSSILLWMLGSSIALWLFAADFQNLDGMIIASSTAWGRDFVNVWTGGRLVLEQNLDILYSVNSYMAYQADISGVTEPHNYSYPPHSLFLAAPFGLLPYGFALAIWLAGTAALFLRAAKSYVSDVAGFPLLLTILTPAATINIWAGHYGFLIGALWLACFARAQSAPLQGGLLASVMTIKPHLGILIPLIFVIRRMWRTIAVAAIGFAALVVGSGLIFGFDLWAEYLSGTSRYQMSLLEADGNFFLLMMPTALPAFRSVMAADWMAWAAQAITAGAAFYLCLKAQRNGASMREMAFIAATATFLILPYAFNYDMTVVSLGIALLLHGQWRQLNMLERAALIAGFVSPQAGMLLTIADLPLVPAILLAVLIVQVRRCGMGAPDLEMPRSILWRSARHLASPHRAVQ